MATEERKSGGQGLAEGEEDEKEGEKGVLTVLTVGN